MVVQIKMYGQIWKNVNKVVSWQMHMLNGLLVSYRSEWENLLH